jgi:hypothetical protein
MRRALAVATAAVIVSLGLTGLAASAASTVALTSTKPQLTIVNDATATTTLTFVNVGTDNPKVTVTAADCQTSLEPATLVASVQSEVKLTLTGCHVNTGDAVDLTVKAADATWTITASAGSGDKPPWDRLWVSFLIGLVVAVVLVLLTFMRWNGSSSVDSWHEAFEHNPFGDKRRKLWGEPLPGLGHKYDVTKSWASNITIVTSVFAGVFGSSAVVKTLIGKDPESVLAVAVVAAAIAAGLVAIAPIVIGATNAAGDGDGGGGGDRRTSEAARKRPEPEPESQASDAPRTRFTSVYGLLLAAVVTLTATIGQLGVLVSTAANLELGPVDELMPIIGVLALALLVVYAYRSLIVALTVGKSLPDPDAPDGGDDTDGANANIVVRNLDNADGISTVQVVVRARATGRPPALL